MNHPITTTLSANVYHFLQEEAKKLKTSRKKVIEQALKEYQKQKLSEQVKTGLQERKEEYADLQTEFRKAQINSIKD